MSIVFFTRLFYPHIGGVETHVMEISRELVKKGYNVTVITENHGSSQKEIVEKIAIMRITVGKEDWFKKFRVWSQLWKYRNIIINANIIHCHDVFFWYLPFRFLYPQKRVYTTFHGYETAYPPRFQAKIVRKLSEKLSKGNICIGSFIQKWYGTKPNFVSYGGVTILKKIKHSIERKHLKLTIVFIGRLTDDTGLPFYNTVIQELKKKYRNIEFILLGDGKYKKRASRVGVVKGFVENIDMYIQKADVIFSSSYLSILQALAQSKVVFSYYDNPLKYDYLSMTPFSKYIRIMNDQKKTISQLEQIIQNHKVLDNSAGYNFAKKQSWKRVCDMYLQLWQI